MRAGYNVACAKLQYHIGDNSRMLASRCYPAISRRDMDSASRSPRLADSAPPARSPSPTGCCSSPALVFLMVVVGGITRLTESGLQHHRMEADQRRDPAADRTTQWQHAFDLYKATPEYREINGPAGMDLAAVQVHLLLGMGPPAARPADRPRLRAAARLVRGEAARSRRAMAGGWSRCCCSAAARARSAGTWSSRASSSGPTSAISASRRICCSPCSSWPR